MDSTNKSKIDEETDETDHLNDLEDGCGCTEIWEHMSEQRDSADNSDTDSE